MATVPKRFTEKSSLTDQECWEAVLHREKEAADAFVYSVKTTGVYCRPSCPARRARRENVDFHRTAQDAERAGYRPCKRCRPNEPGAPGEAAALVARACQLIAEAEEPLSLDALAGACGMSSGHFHRMFRAATGLTPKAYASAHRARRAQEELSRRGTVTEAIFQAGFQSSGRFYAESNKRLGMKPARFRAGGEGATIRFAAGECSLGSILVAATDLGVCSIALGDDPGGLVRELEDRFPRAELIGGDPHFEEIVARVIALVEKPAAGLDLPLHVRGTAFQQRVWKALCEIPRGTTCTYAELAGRLGQPGATRAVAGACAANPLAVAIPCHRVVRTDGALSGYRWGVERKQKLLQAEGAAQPATDAELNFRPSGTPPRR